MQTVGQWSTIISATYHIGRVKTNNLFIKTTQLEVVLDLIRNCNETLTGRYSLSCGVSGGIPAVRVAEDT